MKPQTINKPIIRLPKGMAVLFILSALMLSACQGSKIIKEKGLSYAHLGGEMPAVGIKTIKGHPVSDTLMDEDGYQWRVSVLDYKLGKVYLEEDFFMKDVLNRIRIETPELKLKNGLNVGKTVGALADITDKWYIHPEPTYNVFDFYSQLIPRVHFIISEPGRSMDEKDWEKYPISSFKRESKIVAIVVF